MQLNDILEENSARAISQKTKISEDNLENLLAKRFENLKRIKTLGFISIIEREYKADLSTLRDEAYEYYSQSGEDRSITLGLPIIEEKKGTSKIFLFLIFGLLAYATWYFLTQFDKKNLSELIPFIDEATIESFVGKNDTKLETAKELNIAKVSEIQVIVEEKVPEIEKIVVPVVAEVMTDDVSVIDQNISSVSVTEEVAMIKQIASIVPINRLWFGLIDMETNKRDHFSISDTFELDIGTKSWLVATSSAPFSLKVADATKEFNDAKEHYFKIDKNSVEVLSKNEYVMLGGWAQW
jgi:hypothetical protein